MFHAICPVCDGDGKHRQAPVIGFVPCVWCNQTGIVTETQRDWLIDEAAHLYIPGRDDEALVAEFRDEFHIEPLGNLADGFEQLVARIDDQDITRLAREIGILA